MLDIRIMIGAFVVCVSIFVIGARLLATNEALLASGPERPDFRISASERPELNVSAAPRVPFAQTKPASIAAERTAPGAKPIAIPVATSAPATVAAKPAPAAVTIAARPAAEPSAGDITGSVNPVANPVADAEPPAKARLRRTGAVQAPEPDAMSQLMMFFYRNSIAK
jgi:hypothetical protein